MVIPSCHLPYTAPSSLQNVNTGNPLLMKPRRFPINKEKLKSLSYDSVWELNCLEIKENRSLQTNLKQTKQTQDSQFSFKVIDKLLPTVYFQMFYTNLDPHQMGHLLTQAVEPRLGGARRLDS